jgi:hypothetical protein
MSCSLSDMGRPVFFGGRRRWVVRAIDVGMICNTGKRHGLYRCIRMI